MLTLIDRLFIFGIPFENFHGRIDAPTESIRCDHLKTGGRHEQRGASEFIMVQGMRNLRGILPQRGPEAGRHGRKGCG